MKTIEFREYPGYIGGFTRNQAEGAITNGSRIVKIMSEENDSTPTGAYGTVLGSLQTPPQIQPKFPDVDYFYFVEWDWRPGYAVGIVSTKIDIAFEGQINV